MDNYLVEIFPLSVVKIQYLLKWEGEYKAGAGKVGGIEDDVTT